MTRDEAAQLLNVSSNASQAEIQTKFQEMYNEYQIRLTNAPTPNLKKIYQNNLQELNTALTVLSGKTSAAITDLPSSTPTYRHVEQQHTPPPAPVAETKTAETQVKAPIAGKTKEKKGVPSSTITAIGVALVAIAAVVFLVIKTVEDKAAIAKLQLSADSVTVYAQELDRYKSAFDNRMLKIKNDGNDFTITGFSVTYWNEFNKLEKREIGTSRFLRKGSSIELNWIEGSRIIWDGSVVSYAIGIQYNGDNFFVSGVFSKEMKPEDKTLHLNFDNL